MRPALWIGILALVGALLGLALYRWTGWLGTAGGALLGILVGTVLYARLREKK